MLELEECCTHHRDVKKRAAVCCVVNERPRQLRDMATKAIREYDGKKILARWVNELSGGKHKIRDQFVRIDGHQHVTRADYQQVEVENPWLFTERLVVKPDQLIKRRGKAGLLALDVTWEEAQVWIKERMLRDVVVDDVTGVLENFIVEPFTPHADEDEYYICIQSQREGEELLFTHEGGVDVGNVDDKASRCLVPIGDKITEEGITTALLGRVPALRRPILASFLKTLFEVFTDLHFAYLEINPLVMLGDDLVVPLDLAAKLDECAMYKCAAKWGR